MKVKSVYIFLDFSPFVRLSLEAWVYKGPRGVLDYPKMKASAALVLYHTQGL